MLRCRPPRLDPAEVHDPPAAALGRRARDRLGAASLDGAEVVDVVAHAVDEVIDAIDVGERTRERVGDAHVALNPFDPDELVTDTARRGAHGLAGREQSRHEGAADESRGAENERGHWCSLGQRKNWARSSAWSGQATRSKRSRFITFVHAATKSRTNFSCASALP